MAFFLPATTFPRLNTGRRLQQFEFEEITTGDPPASFVRRSLTRRRAAVAASVAPATGASVAPATAGAIPIEGARRGTGGKFSPVLAGGLPPPTLAPATPRVEGGPVMGLRAQLISPSSFLPTAAPTLLGGLIQGGLDIVNTLVGAKFGGVGVGSPSPTPFAATNLGGLVPTIGGGPIGMAAVIAAVAAVGGAVVGTVIRVTRAGWTRIPAIIKSAAIALGLTVALTDADVLGGGGGGELSMAQQRKIDRFQQLTGAGVPPGLAARAVGIGRRRRRGISAFELSGFRKISHLLGHVGMVPRGLRGARPSRGHHHHK